MLSAALRVCCWRGISVTTRQLHTHVRTRTPVHKAVTGTSVAPLLSASLFFSRWQSGHGSAGSTSEPGGLMELRQVIAKLEEFAPLNRAAEWDNVGLLVEPKRFRGRRGRGWRGGGASFVRRVFLTNDLTEAVMDEVEGLPGSKVDLVVSYHPPIFRPLKRLTQSSAKERIILRVVELGAALYSPHTAHDSVYGGVNDWLLSGLGKGEVSGLTFTTLRGQGGLGGCGNHLMILNVDSGEKMEVAVMEQFEDEVTKGHFAVNNDFSPQRRIGSLDISCSDGVLKRLLHFLNQNFPTSVVTMKPSPQVPVLGGGRLLSLAEPVELSELVERVKRHLGLNHVRLATPHDMDNGQPSSLLTSSSSSSTDGEPGSEGSRRRRLVSTVAACAGSGGSLLRGVRADVLLTGEMSHHEVLEATSTGSAVVLCEHSNTERGFFLHVFAKTLRGMLGSSVDVTVSQVDKDPLQIV